MWTVDDFIVGGIAVFALLILIGGFGKAWEGTPGQGTPGQGTPGQGTPGQGTPGQDSASQKQSEICGDLAVLQVAMDRISICNSSVSQ